MKESKILEVWGSKSESVYGEGGGGGLDMEGKVYDCV